MKVIEAPHLSPRIIEARPAYQPEPRARVALLLGVSALLMFAVLAFGAVETWAASVIEIGAAGLFVACAIFGFINGKLPFRWSPLFWPAFIFAALVAAQLAFGLTAYRYGTMVAAMQYLAYAVLLFVTVQARPGQGSARLVLLLWAAFGSALSVFAVCQSLASNGKLYWIRTPQLGGSIFGPYVNHNHYAGLMEMLVPFALAISGTRLVTGAQRILFGFGCVIMVGSIVLSRSRGGTVSLAVEVLVFVWLTSLANRRRVLRPALLAVMVAAGLLVIWLGTGALWRHFGELQDNTRGAIFRDGWRMFRARPFWGWGLGSFPTAYPQFRSFYTNRFVNAAHNDYLQVLIETGLAGFACVVWFIVCLYRRALRELSTATNDWIILLRVACLAGCTGLLVHSLVDFNLQIPANAGVFYLLCGLAATSDSNRGVRET